MESQGPRRPSAFSYTKHPFYLFDLFPATQSLPYISSCHASTATSHPAPFCSCPQREIWRYSTSFPPSSYSRNTTATRQCRFDASSSAGNTPYTCSVRGRTQSDPRTPTQRRQRRVRPRWRSCVWCFRSRSGNEPVQDQPSEAH
jgi:hypothetical protein